MAKFEYNEAAENDPIRIEQVWAEKPAGGVVHVTEDMPATTPVILGEDGVFEAHIGQAKTYEMGTGVEEASNFGFLKEEQDVVGKFVCARDAETGVTTRALKVVSIESQETEGFGYKITMSTKWGVNVDKENAILLACKPKEGVDNYEPAELEETSGNFVYITGNDLKAEDGEYQPVRLINGANVRKETAVITEEEAKQMKGIHLV